MTNISKQNAVNNIYSDLYKQVRCASTANVTIATDLNAGDTIDGITLVAGDLVLLKNQTAGAENGIYVVSASPARWVNYNSDSAIRGSKVLVKEGTAGAGFIWACGNTSAITVDSTSITYTRTVRETIMSSMTLTVKTAGGDFTTISGAYAYLSNYEISSSVTVTINVDDGVWSISSTIALAHPNGDRITLQGVNSYTKTINSVVSSGSKTADGGNYYYDHVINVDSIANVAIGDFIIVPYSVSGGTAPKMLGGVHEVMDINYIFTISTGSATAGATYTNNGNTYTVVKTVASGTTLICSGLAAPAGSGTLTKTSGTGDNTLSFSSVAVGLTVRVYNVTNTIPSGSVTTNSAIIIKTIIDTSSGGLSLSSGYANVKTLVVRRSTNKFSSGTGINISPFASMLCTNVGVGGGFNQGVSAYGYCSCKYVSGNNNGYLAWNSLCGNINQGCFTGNYGTLGGIMAYNTANIDQYQGIIAGNTLGVYAYGNSFVYTSNGYLTGNTTASNPAINTLSADQSYIANA